MHRVIQEDLATIAAEPLEWTRLSGKTVLVTGGAGFLPSYMVETLLWMNDKRNLQCKVICLVRNLAKASSRFAHHKNRSDIKFCVSDVSGPITIDEPCHYIVHAASQASPRFYSVDPVGTMGANLLGTWSLLQKAREWSSEGFLFFSSGEVYGQVAADKIPTAESDYGYIDILNPRSCYGESKRASETLGICFFTQYKVPFVIARPFHTYGPGMALDDRRVFADFVADVVYRRDITINGDGKAVRAFCYIADAVRAFFRVMISGQHGRAYNVGNPAGAVSIGDLAEIICGLRPNLGLSIRRSERPAGEAYAVSPISKNIPDISAILDLGWSPTHGISDGFDRTLCSFGIPL